MKKTIGYKILFCLLIVTSLNADAQLKLLDQKKSPASKLNVTLPKSIYFEPAIDNFSLLNKVKSELKLYPQKESSNITPMRRYIISQPDMQNLLASRNAKPQKIGSNESLNFYKMPVDNMVCVVPNNQTKLHINIYNPAVASDYADNMPNALPKIDFTK